MKNQCRLILTLLLVFVLSSCTGFLNSQRKEYGVLQSAASQASDAVIGEYGDSIPNDFTAEKFMGVVKDKIPSDYYAALVKYEKTIEPKGSYYLLLVYKKNIFTAPNLILFDYSCTSEVDGPVWLEPQKYDVTHLELYDKCK